MRGFAHSAQLAYSDFHYQTVGPTTDQRRSGKPPPGRTCVWRRVDKSLEIGPRTFFGLKRPMSRGRCPSTRQLLRSKRTVAHPQETDRGKGIEGRRSAMRIKAAHLGLKCDGRRF